MDWDESDPGTVAFERGTVMEATTKTHYGYDEDDVELFADFPATITAHICQGCGGNGVCLPKDLDRDDPMYGEVEFPLETCGECKGSGAVAVTRIDFERAKQTHPSELKLYVELVSRELEEVEQMEMERRMGA